jgi:hypothetical protein
MNEYSLRIATSCGWCSDGSSAAAGGLAPQLALAVVVAVEPGALLGHDQPGPVASALSPTVASDTEISVWSTDIE